MTSAFQANAFQNNAFQIAAGGGGGTVVNSLPMIASMGQMTAR